MKKRKLFVGNLDFSVTANQLKEFLSSHGTVINAKLMEGKGYAFIEMESEEQALTIRRTLSESVFKGRKLLIDTVPGTRRPEKGSKTSHDSRERKSPSGPGKKTDQGHAGGGRREQSFELKSRESSKESRSPVRQPQSVRKRDENDPRSDGPSGTKSSKPSFQEKNDNSSSKPAPKPQNSNSKNQEKKPNPVDGSKPVYSSPQSRRRSRVPSWVREKRSAGSKFTKDQY